MEEHAIGDSGDLPQAVKRSSYLHDFLEQAQRLEGTQQQRINAFERRAATLLAGSTAGLALVSIVGFRLADSDSVRFPTAIQCLVAIATLFLFGAVFFSVITMWPRKVRSDQTEGLSESWREWIQLSEEHPGHDVQPSLLAQTITNLLGDRSEDGAIVALQTDAHVRGNWLKAAIVLLLLAGVSLTLSIALSVLGGS